jgi:hypothetical protein
MLGDGLNLRLACQYIEAKDLASLFAITVVYLATWGLGKSARTVAPGSLTA